MSNQIDGARVAAAPDRVRFWARRCRVAFVATASALKKRPATVWYEVARSDGRTQDPGARAVECCQLAIRTALQSGDRESLRATAQHVVDYFETLKAAALYEVPADPEMDATTLALVANKEGHEALAALFEAQVNPCEVKRERAVREWRELLDAGGKLLRTFTFSGGSRDAAHAAQR